MRALQHLRPIALAAGVLLLSACAEPATPPLAQCPPAPLPPPSASAAPAETQTPSARKRYDVVIVGAGMAGITAAKVLRRANLEVVVLEATGRIGGRGITTESRGPGTLSVPIDLGGAWIHGVKTNPLTPLIAGTGYETQRSHLVAWDHLFYDGKFAPRDKQKKFKKGYEAFEAALEKKFGKKGDEARDENHEIRSAASFLTEPDVSALDPVSLRLLALNAGPLEGATELEKSSLEDASNFVSDDDDLLRRGYGTFVEEYGEEIRPLVHLGSPVTRIKHGGGGVEVTTDKGEVFEGRKVVVTVSTGVLAKKKIAFEPDLLQAKKDAIDGLPMGLLNKVILEFTTPDVFPRHARNDKDAAAGKTSLEDTWVLYGGADKKGKDDLALVLRPLGTNIAIGFFGGQRAWDLEKLDKHGEDVMVDVAIRAMTEMCEHSDPRPSNCNVRGALKRPPVITWWGKTEWVYGAYSAALPGKAKMREELSTPIDHTVYFAGEACFNASYNGSFAGAYNSALRAGYGIIECLGHEKRHEACVWQPITR